MSPESRYGRDLQKAPPCGDPEMGPAGDPVATYTAGETITVELDEFVDHDSHFRLSLSVDGDGDFADPTAFDDFYTNDAVLLDDIADEGRGPRSIEVTLPDIDCPRCTLQLIQVMYGASFDPERSLYYQCADIVIVGDPGSETSGQDGEAGTAEDTASTTEDSGGSTTSQEETGDDGPSDETGDDDSDEGAETSDDDSEVDEGEEDDEGEGHEEGDDEAGDGGGDTGDDSGEGDDGSGTSGDPGPAEDKGGCRVSRDRVLGDGWSLVLLFCGFVAGPSQRRQRWSNA